MSFSVSIVVPAYNEEAALSATVARSLAVLDRCATDFEIVIADDGSTDGTAEVIRELQREHPETIRAIFHETNRGITATFEELYQAATKEFVFLVAGDGQFPPEALLECAPSAASYDIIVCQRIRRAFGWWRRFVSWSYRWLSSVAFGVDLYDPGAVKLIRRRLIEEIPVNSKGVFAEAERVIRAARRGFRIGCVRIEHAPRHTGTAYGGRVSLIAGALVDLVALWVRLRLRSES